MRSSPFQTWIGKIKEERLGRLSFLVNQSGITPVGRLPRTEPCIRVCVEDWKAVTGLSLERTAFDNNGVVHLRVPCFPLAAL